MPSNTHSPILPLDPAILAPRPRAAAASKAREEAFALPDHRPESPGARRASPSRPEASSFGQARAEARSTARGEPREPARSRRPDEPRTSDRGPLRHSGSAEDARPVRESGDAACSEEAACTGEAAAEPGAQAEIVAPPEEIAEDGCQQEGDLVAQNATAPALTLPTQADGEAVPSAQEEAGAQDALPETGAAEAPAIEASPQDLALGQLLPMLASGAAAGTPAESAPEVNAVSPSLPGAGTEAASDALASPKSSRNPTGAPPEGAPEPGSSGGTPRPEALPSAQAVAHAPEAALERGIQTASLATASHGNAPGAVRAPAGAGAPAPASLPVPLGAVPIEIGLRSLAGLNRFEIRLDPAELGRIEVRLDIGEGGEVKAHLTVDRVETLALLQRDARTLERAFEQAGLKPSEGGIDLTLRDQQGRGARDERRESEAPAPLVDETDRRAEMRNSPVAAPRPLQWRSGLDVRV